MQLQTSEANLIRNGGPSPKLLQTATFFAFTPAVTLKKKMKLSADYKTLLPSFRTSCSAFLGADYQ